MSIERRPPSGTRSIKREPINKKSTQNYQSHETKKQLHRQHARARTGPDGGIPYLGKTPNLENFYQGCGEKVELACQDLGNRLDGGTKDGRVCEKRMEQQRRRAVRPVTIPPSVHAKFMSEQMSKLRARHNITLPRPKVKPVAPSRPHPRLPKTPIPKPVKAAKPVKANL